jgi:hypothetical protein
LHRHCFIPAKQWLQAVTNSLHNPAKSGHGALKGCVTPVHSTADKSAKSIRRERPKARTTRLIRQTTKVHAPSLYSITTEKQHHENLVKNAP